MVQQDSEMVGWLMASVKSGKDRRPHLTKQIVLDLEFALTSLRRSWRFKSMPLRHQAKIKAAHEWVKAAKEWKNKK